MKNLIKQFIITQKDRILFVLVFYRLLKKHQYNFYNS